MNVVVVGGGNASITLIDYFWQMDQIAVQAVIDVNENAPGVIHARKLGIRTFSDLAALASLPDVETIIELTGSTTARQTLLSQLKPNQHFMSSNAARMMCNLIEMQASQRVEATRRLSDEFDSLTSRLRSSEEYIGQSTSQIEDVLRSMKIVTINARIEAARAGQSGKAFEVVVQAMQGTLGNIETALKNIKSASNEWKSTMADLANTKKKLSASL